ncbi:MAG: NADPH-dependent 7-cyano-7-deazaguanine reductase QueF [Gemmatimonadales bacterium]|nr:NADPH-dependent 7-cyano-7-deazaguanine reductase QueF [Gemmatimonadales bacterium]
MATAEGRTIPFIGVEAIDTAVLETFPYDGPEQEISTVTNEFSAVCPFSGLPDQAILTLRYVPSDCCVELKSLKYYVMSYRNVGIFQEHATARLAEDLQRVLRARTLTVTTLYNVRGGFETTCSVTLTTNADG